MAAYTTTAYTTSSTYSRNRSRTSLVSRVQRLRCSLRLSNTLSKMQDQTKVVGSLCVSQTKIGDHGFWEETKNPWSVRLQ